MATTITLENNRCIVVTPNLANQTIDCVIPIASPSTSLLGTGAPNSVVTSLGAPTSLLQTLSVAKPGSVTPQSSSPTPNANPPAVNSNTGAITSVSQPATPSLHADNSTILSSARVQNGSVNVAHSNNGLAGGAVAGVAIGMLLAGVLIAGAVFFFLLRRQRGKQAAQTPISHLPPASYGSGQEKGPVATTRAVPSSIDNLLPQPASDDEINGHVSKIRDSIKNHVREYYHSASLTTNLNEAALRDVASATGLSSAVLVGALSNPSTRPDTLRLIVAWTILSKTTGGRNASLLPSHLARLSEAIPNTGGNATQVNLYSKWKAITGALLQQGSGKSVHDPNRAQAFSGIIAELDSIVEPFIQGTVAGGQRQKNLDFILNRSTTLAFLLFSQPGSFQFEFASRHGGLMAFPALLQSVGDDGQVLSPPRGLSKGEVVAV
ncbi:hypothetical protein CC86DRAFT_433269 [Ophiobolus disseminans]|uniref:Uncharacterized protein n=1 Tax=Ophiobolus disseminans TaxID=1469910 RepID=A0A6A6ZBX4_9PLEO|nr:hypothetical protein CC86DRAFT_433269 [Ophiobolus disseminans]